jgi:dienelactone hydrolase
VHGATRASARLSRRLSRAPVSVTPETLGKTGFYGEFFSPTTTVRRPAVLIIGGSQGGLASMLAADLLAAHGYPALAIAYFNEPGLPSELIDIPLEYFAGALRWLRRQPQVEPQHVLTLGISFGSEAALLLGAYYPGLVNGVIASVPSDVATCAAPGCVLPAWTLHGRALPYTSEFDVPHPTDVPAAVIPVERIKGPVFLDCGGADKTWVSCRYAQAIMSRLTAHHDAYQHILAAYPAAGHGVGYLVPYEPAGDASPEDSGASADANPNATAELWPRLLLFLASMTPAH